MARSSVAQMTTLIGSPVSGWRRKNGFLNYYFHAKYIDIEKKYFFSWQLVYKLCGCCCIQWPSFVIFACFLVIAEVTQGVGKVITPDRCKHDWL